MTSQQERQMTDDELITEGALRHAMQRRQDGWFHVRLGVFIPQEQMDRMVTEVRRRQDWKKSRGIA